MSRFSCLTPIITFDAPCPNSSQYIHTRTCLEYDREMTDNYRLKIVMKNIR
jgi:hypothetical protein